MNRLHAWLKSLLGVCVSIAGLCVAIKAAMHEIADTVLDIARTLRNIRSSDDFQDLLSAVADAVTAIGAGSLISAGAVVIATTIVWRLLVVGPRSASEVTYIEDVKKRMRSQKPRPNPKGPQGDN